MFKPLIAKIGPMTYRIKFTPNSEVHTITMSILCAQQLQQYIDKVDIYVPKTPITDIPREPVAGTGHDYEIPAGDRPSPGPWIDAPDDRANGDHKEMDDGVCY